MADTQLPTPITPTERLLTPPRFKASRTSRRTGARPPERHARDLSHRDQGHRPAGAADHGRQNRDVRWSRGRQDGAHRGADLHHGVRAVRPVLALGEAGKTLTVERSRALSIAMTRAMALELAPYRTRFDTIAPGLTDTA
jgi:hypothetical protein